MAKKNWIKGAVKHPGALTKQANAAGQTVHQFAEEHKGDKGTTGKRLALTFEQMAHHMYGAKS